MNQNIEVSCYTPRAIITQAISSLCRSVSMAGTGDAPRCLYIKGDNSNPGHLFHSSNRPRTSRILPANAIVSLPFPYLSSFFFFVLCNEFAGNYRIKRSNLNTFEDHRGRSSIVIIASFTTWWVFQCSSCEFSVDLFIWIFVWFLLLFDFLFFYLSIFFDLRFI